VWQQDFENYGIETVCYFFSATLNFTHVSILAHSSRNF